MPLTAALPYHLHLHLFEERHWQFTKDFCPEMPLTAAALLNHLPGNSCQGYIVIFPLPWIVIFYWLLFTEWVTGYGWLELKREDRGLAKFYIFLYFHFEKQLWPVLRGGDLANFGNIPRMMAGWSKNESESYLGPHSMSLMIYIQFLKRPVRRKYSKICFMFIFIQK